MRVIASRFGSLLFAVSSLSLLTHCGSSGGDVGPGDQDSGTDETLVDGAPETIADSVTTEATAETAADSSVDDSTIIDSATAETSDSATTETSADAADAADTSIADAADTATADTATTDTADADAGCAPLSSTAVDVYVDKSSTKASVGTRECPFHTVGEGTSLAAPTGSTRTIHVVNGGSTLADYAEGGLEVKANVVLLGDGLTKVKISGSGACREGGGNCTVLVDGTGTLDGFLVSGSGITTSATGKAIVKNTEVTGSSGDGLRVLGSVDLTNIQASANATNGMTVTGSGAVHVLAGASVINDFDGNGGDGINVGGTAMLTFDGGTASSNKGSGVVLGSTLAVATPHKITGLTANSNGVGTAAKSTGIVVQNSNSLSLRSSTTLMNTGAGLWMTYGTANALDIGFTGSPGANAFTSPDTTKRNRIGLCLDSSGATATQPADGDKWSTCTPAPTQTAVSNCTSAMGGTASIEIGYKSKVGGGGAGADPVLITGCTVAP